MTALALPLSVFPTSAQAWPANPQTTNLLTINAAGEYVDYIGHVYWDGEAASKTISSAGGAIVTLFGSATFGNAGTTLRMGIQDVDAATGNPARGDGTHDVYAELVGGTDTITSNTLRSTAMETNTKTISHGQLVAVRFELTARAAPDSLALNCAAAPFSNQSYPGVTHNPGAVAAVNGVPNVQLVADDGTAGWLSGGLFYSNITARTFDSATATADEYASIVQWPFELAVCGLVFHGRWTTAAGTMKAILYSDPLGTPVAERSVTLDTEQSASLSNNGIHQIMFSSAYTVPANTNIALSLQPQDATGDTVALDYSLGSAITGRTKQWKSLGGTWSKGTRLDASGALTQDTDSIMLIGALVNNITTGGGSAGGVMPVGPGFVVT